MLWLEHKIIVIVGTQEIDDLARLSLPAMFHQSLQIRTPTPEVIVHINDRDARLLRALFQLGDLARHRWRITHQLIRFRKIEVVDDIDN